MQFPVLVAAFLLTTTSAFARNHCEVPTGDPKFPVEVKESCCLSTGGKIYENRTGHPPIDMCDGGKYDGWYVSYDCEVESGDPQFPKMVKASCCVSTGGKVDDNTHGHPPIAMCHDGKYDGWYVTGEK